MEEERDKEEILPKWSKNLLKTISGASIVHLLAGSVMVMVGMTALTGGSMGFKAYPEAEPAWFAFDVWPAGLCWFVILSGFDTALTKGKITNWLFKKIKLAIRFILSNIVSEETIAKLDKWDKKMEEKADKL